MGKDYYDNKNVIESLVGSCSEANLTRIKAILRNLTKTKREKEIFALLFDEYTRDEIEQELGISRQKIGHAINAVKQRIPKEIIDEFYDMVRQQNIGFKLYNGGTEDAVH
jgi:DNA-directed RNA polymerase specialized sigma subunit